MTARASKTPKVSEAVGTDFEIGFRAQLRMMTDAFWGSPVRNRLLFLAGGLLTIIVVTAMGQVMLNRWNAPFFDALSRRDMAEFKHQLMIFALIAGTLLVLNVSQTWLNQMTALKMREGLARDLVDQWMTSRRAIRLAGAGEIGINPDQRLHEDARHLAEITTSLGIGLVQATIMLVSFLGVLWELSSGFVFHVAGRSFTIPGYMVWAAILYAGSASLMSYLVGRKLMRLNADRYSKEAELRFSLMRANENLTAITVARGEAKEAQRIHGDINSVLSVIRKLAIALTNLTWVSAGYGWLTIVAPILIAAPVYFSGGLTFGGLMMAVGAFNQVHSSLRWYVDNFGAIADWKATLFRVSTFRAALLEMDKPLPDEGHISVTRSADDTIRFSSLTVATSRAATAPAECYRLQEGDTTIHSGEKVMINGDAGINRKLLFMAMTGLWRWGSGRIAMPSAATMLFMPQVPYFPTGLLRDSLCFPLASDNFTSAEMVQALEQVKLGHLIPMLDTHGRWDKLLGEDEQTALAFANMLLQKPQWIVFEEVLDGVEPELQSHLIGLLETLSGATLIYIGRSDIYRKLVSPRILHLEKQPLPA